MKIEEYLQTLPENLLNGEDIQVSDKMLREIFRFVDMGPDDVFYHLGCGDERGACIAADEFHAAKAVGIDSSADKIRRAQEALGQNDRIQMACYDVREADISDGTVVLYWFADDDVTDSMMEKFEALSPGTRVVTVWGPLPGCLPDSVRFPYVINRVPFRNAGSVQEQVLAVFGVRCVDFVTAWEFAERYTKATGLPDVKNDRFLTIIQTLVIWANAKKLGVACEDEVPESIRTYVKLMKMNFDIDFGHLLE